MAYTALEVAQAVADEAGLGAPSSLIDRANPTSRQILSLMNRAGRTLVRSKNTKGGGWTFLTREYTFTGEDGVRDYALPADYVFLIDKPNTPNTCLLYTSPSPRDS